MHYISLGLILRHLAQQLQRNGKKQAELWNCKSMITIVYVTLKYHCLLNHWRNETLEFCGEEKTIIGKNNWYLLYIQLYNAYIFHQFNFIIMCHYLICIFFFLICDLFRSPLPGIQSRREQDSRKLEKEM